MAEDIGLEEFLRLKAEGVFTPKEVAYHLGYSVSYVYQLVYEGKLPVLRWRGRILVRKRDLDEFVRRHLKEGVG